MSELVGRELQGYRIDAELGRGGQAVVYRATQLSLQRTVALKVVSGALSSDANFKERFTREGIAAASLDHPHVIPVFEAGEADGMAFLAMKFIDGPSLDAVLHRPGGVEPRRTLAILRQVAEALDYMAERGMVHRDVKPANILLGPGDHAYLSDFGLIKALSASRLTSSGVWMGTLEYVAPEQIRGGDITPAADRYALAALAFEALTGRTLFPRDDRTATLFAHVNDEPPAASSLNPALGAGVDAVLAQGLAKEPGARHASAVALVDGLARAVAAAPGAAEARPPLLAAPPPPPPPPPPPSPAPGPTVTGDAAATPSDHPTPPVPVAASAPPSDPAAPPASPAPSGGGDRGDRRPPMPLLVGGGVVAAIIVVLAVMFAAGAFSGESRTVTTFVVDASSRTVTGPGGETLGTVLPADIPGWSSRPAGEDIANLTIPPGATVESAEFARGDEVALVAGLRSDGGGAGAFDGLGEAVDGTDLGDPGLAPGVDDAWARAVVDGTAVAFRDGDRVVLVLAPDSDVALELARGLSEDGA